MPRLSPVRARPPRRNGPRTTRRCPRASTAATPVPPGRRRCPLAAWHVALAALRGVQSPPGARKAAADVRWQRGTWHWQRSEECSLAPHDHYTSRRPGAHKAVVGGRAGAEGGARPRFDRGGRPRDGAERRTGIAFVDNMHLNVEGRRFTAQLLLNLMRQLLPA
eukprot:scaffold43552_cov75-Phaeocystis_antarctica.AAC.3